MTHRGSCFCGAVAIEADGEPLDQGYCHCDDCRAYSGAPVSTFTIWPADAVRVTKGGDLLGGFDKAIEVFRTKAKLGKDENIRLVPYPPRRSIWTKFLSPSNDSVVDREVRAWMTRHGITGLDPVLLRGGMMRLMPYSIDIR